LTNFLVEQSEIKRIKAQAIGLVPFGMLERWSIGKIGFGNRNVGLWATFDSTKTDNGIISIKKASIPYLR
jgi:hypothetical protein